MVFPIFSWPGILAALGADLPGELELGVHRRSECAWQLRRAVVVLGGSRERPYAYGSPYDSHSSAACN